MKKKFLLIASLILIAVISVVCFAPVSFGIKKQVTIAAPIFNVANQVTDLKNWPRWNSHLKNKDSSLIKRSPLSNQDNSWLRAGDEAYSVVSVTAASILVREDSANKRVYQSIFVFPDSDAISTHVVWIENLSPLSWIKEKLSPSGDIAKSLSNLKNYFEDIRLYYGFDIRIDRVLDTLEVTEIETTAKGRQNDMLKSMYKNIIAFAKENNLTVDRKAVRMANFYAVNKDSVRIMAAIPVNKKVPAAKNISVLQMPAHGRMLTGYYEGDYNGFKKLYGAMDRYVVDKRLKLIAVPYERYLTDPQSAQDSLRMKIELCYPVF